MVWLTCAESQKSSTASRMLSRLRRCHPTRYVLIVGSSTTTLCRDPNTLATTSSSSPNWSIHSSSVRWKIGMPPSWSRPFSRDHVPSSARVERNTRPSKETRVTRLHEPRVYRRRPSIKKIQPSPIAAASPRARGYVCLFRAREPGYCSLPTPAHQLR